MSMCAAYMCENSERNRPPGISFHRFPIEPTLRSKWIEAIGLHDWEPKMSSVLCSLHFDSKMFYTDKSKIKLQPNAMPTIIDKLPIHSAKTTSSRPDLCRFRISNITDEQSNILRIKSLEEQNKKLLLVNKKQKLKIRALQESRRRLCKKMQEKFPESFQNTGQCHNDPLYIGDT